MKNLFLNYLKLREETESKENVNGSITSRVKLQKGSKEFSPFTVDRKNHANLRTLIKAFADSPNIGVGYTTIDKSKGEVEPQLKKKSLFLTGGAVRDHLKGKTPKNYDIVTDATVSEMRMILTQSEDKFTEVKPKSVEHTHDTKYAKLPIAGSKNKIFYVSRWDKQGKELEITVEINGEQFNIATLSKHSKNKNTTPDKGESASSVEEDSANRDFTINALYIPLTTFDGDNSELVDPHGGAHHLKNKEVKSIGKLDGRLSSDPSIALRYINMTSRFGNPDQVPDDDKSALDKHRNSLLNTNDLRKEFISGLEHPDNDPRKFMTLFNNSGMLNKLFPDISFNPKDMPEDFRGDRWLSTAWILRNNHPEDVHQMLSQSGWSKNEASDIAYLVKLYHWHKNNFDPKDFYDMKSTHTGLTKGKIRDWMAMAKAHGPELDNFLNHEDSDLTPYVHGFDGRRSINPVFVGVLGRSPQGNEFDMIKRHLSTERFKDGLNKLKGFDSI
jgi:tRNA nucleotidyltransferase/poly(A) polymerase